MTAEEIFCDLLDKYGEDFNWRMVPLSRASGFWVEELKKEIGEGHILHHKKIWAVAKCTSTDDVLYVTGGETGRDVYYLFHLTYSHQNIEGFPKYKKFADIQAVKEFIEQSFVQNYM